MLFLVVWIVACIGPKIVNTFHCNRRPYGSTTQPLPADGRFKLVVKDADETYIPDQLYTVRISETDGESRFTAFMISAEGEMRPDPKNPRRLIALLPGELRPENSITTKYSDRCLHSVEHSMLSEKSFIEVYWQAPSTSNGCVTLRAMVAETEDVWYEDGAPLTQRLCEDTRQPDDITPILNYECEICDEAKYEVSFKGIWSRNTHPQMYPENDWKPKYSDLVGASHAVDYFLWAPGNLVTPGFRELAEHANSSSLEAEIREKIGDGVRTMIKGKGHGYPKMNNPTYSFFRTDKTNHLFSVAIALYPSPDWYLGVTRFELCQEDNTWLKERELDLYPWDAGTDSGVSYESANIETFPQDAVARVQMNSYDKNSPFYDMDIKDSHPFGRLHIKLIRTYQRACTDEEETSTQEETTATATATTDVVTTDENEEKPLEPDEPSSEGPLATDPDSSELCPMTMWTDWSPCSGLCDNGKLLGFQRRERYHLVDGIAVEKYDPTVDQSVKKEVSPYCKNIFDDAERRECDDVCEEDDTGDDDLTAEKQIMQPVAPGHAWNSRKRHLSKH